MAEVEIWYDPKANFVFLRQLTWYETRIEWRNPHCVGKRKAMYPKRYDCVLIGEL